MFKIISNNANYNDYRIVDTKVFDNADITLKRSPLQYKLFANDIFDYDTERDSVVIVHSNYRSNQYNAGILDLGVSHGKFKNKMLYLCKPDDKRIPFFLIPYNIPYKFNKSVKKMYITFSFMNWDNEYRYGVMSQNIGEISELVNFYEYIL